ncbi:MAG: tetratricopeptide repeat protein [candidate division KSB1 bacterium]|nr:tetratricopeptide repeat protein [candidate division KSB1 bacterium]MDZ7367660.1 tetratricopeptide repeat protein [candidate division KSB1 bacterium]MDZ7404825.1 tetratricopeptide repeat protein [candidate division KSB1 bacterium]
MTPFKKIVGTSIFSLLLVVVGLFVVCGGSRQQLLIEDDPLAEETSDEAYKDDLLKRLELLESESQTTGVAENSSAAGQASPANDAESSFLTPELFQGMNAEIRQLEKVAAEKDRTIENLRDELEEKSYQAAAMKTAASTRQMNSKPLPRGVESPELNSEYGLAYQDALDDYYVRRFDSAIRKFRELIANNDNHPLADNCQYWIGESYYAMGRYYDAVAEFQKVYAFAKSNKTNDAQLMIGLAFLKSGEKEMARAELSMLMSFNPQSDSAKKAQKYLRLLENV